MYALQYHQNHWFIGLLSGYKNTKSSSESGMLQFWYHSAAHCLTLMIPPTMPRRAYCASRICPLLGTLCALTFESLDPETSFLVCRYISWKHRSSSYTKVIGSRSQQRKGHVCLTKYTHLQVHCLCLKDSLALDSVVTVNFVWYL